MSPEEEAEAEIARDEIDKAEAGAKEALMGLILTAVHTGLIPNATQQTTEFRAKIFMAFYIGYFYGVSKNA